MSKRPSIYGPSETISDVFANFLDAVARFLFWGGLILIAGSIILLIVTYQTVTSGNVLNFADANFNIALYNKFLIGGILAGFVGSSYKFWGEETLVVIQLVAGALLYFGGPFIPTMFSNPLSNDAGDYALQTVQTGGLVLLGLGLVALIIDLGLRARERIKEGSKSDLLKYGKNVKEEREYQNVFMGKCWQLPFCRKFVRERCPIYLSRRCCWKEQVGCMCEEQVIRDAMEGKVIPKDQIAAAKFIPVNNKLTIGQKHERCRQCVIYNEHQKHKYKLALPLTLLGFVGIYMAGRQILLEMTGNVIRNLDMLVGKATLGTSGTGVASGSIDRSGMPFQELMLICFMLIVLAYVLKMIEYAIFRLKV